MKVAIHQPHYWPWLPYMNKMQQADLFVYLDDAQFEKNGYQNRCQLVHPDGQLRWMTMPVEHHLGQTIMDTKIDRKAILKHTATIMMLYSSGYQAYHSELAQVYDGHVQLADLAIATTEWLAGKMAIPVTTIRASSLGPSKLTRSERLAEICANLGATVYLSGSGARDYLDRAPYRIEWRTVQVQRLGTRASHLYGASALVVAMGEGPGRRATVSDLLSKCVTWEYMR